MAAAAETLLAPDFREEPYWWEAAPRPRLEQMHLPTKVDAAIVGAGLTGLNAAIELARAGRSVVVFDAGDPGIGASSRNAGFVGRTLKHSFGDLLRREGLDHAVRVYREMQAAFDAVVERVRDDKIDCHFKQCGRLVLAHSARQFEELGAELELKRKHLGDAFDMVRRAGLPQEIDSTLYVGGGVIPDLGALHPGLYHQGLLDCALNEGVDVVANTEVTGVRREEAGFRLQTARGEVEARDVVVATNGYTGEAVPWFRRRLVPFDAYMIATELLSEERVRQLLPTDRTYIDTNHNIDYLRRSPDSRRILFGGRTGSRTPDLRTMAAALYDSVCRILPGLRGVRLSRVWTGRCAATFDLFPHIAVEDGIHYVGGYCFAGVPMGTYLGRKVAWRILGRREGATLFAERRFPALPLYAGNAWFVPYVMAAYDWRDRRAMRAKAA